MVPEGVEAAGVLSSEAMMRKQAGASGANSAGDAANNANQNANAMLMDEKNERCTQLVDNLPIVEEIRLAARGGFEVRQWTVGGNGTGQQWRVVYVKGASQAGWQRKSSLANLDFHPALADHLVPGKSCYLAFAPAQPRTLAEGDRQAATVMSFGAAVGTFKWNGRIYDYSLADKLPCFEIAE